MQKSYLRQPGPRRSGSSLIPLSSVDGAVDVFPALQGVAEDALHLVFRIEECFGEKRTAVSNHVLLLRCKFRVPAIGAIHHRGEQPPPGAVGQWPESADVVIKSDEEMEAYIKLPYESHQQYINDLADVVLKHPDQMEMKNVKGKTVADILKAGSSYDHYAYLRNGSVTNHKLSVKERAALAWGTSGNEALHNQLKSSELRVHHQHEHVLVTKMKAFCLGKLIAHNSAAYSPTTSQYRQGFVLAVLEGVVMKGFLAPFGHHGISPVTARRRARISVVARSDAKAAGRKAADTARREAWQKCGAPSQEEEPAGFPPRQGPY